MLGHVAGRWLVSAACVATLGSCVEIGAFDCSDAAQCSRDGSAGLCISGRCAYMDPACPSGWRYSDLAGGRAERCAEGAGTTGSGTTSVVSTDTGSSGVSEESTAGSSSGSDPVPSCGNGVVEPGEACDDANEDNADGCNVACERSGAVLWSLDFPGDAGARDVASGITQLAGGDVVACGHQALVRGGEQVWLARVSVEGVVRWERTAGGEDADRCSSIVQGADADLYTTGSTGSEQAVTQTFARYTPEGDPSADTVVYQGQGREGLSIHETGNSFVIAGMFSPARAMVRVISTSGNTVWWAPVPEGRETRLSAAFALSQSQRFVAGERSGDLWLARLNSKTQSVETLDLWAHPYGNPDAAQAMTGDGETLYVAGYAGTSAQRTAWIRAYDLEGGLRWDYESEAVPLDDEFEALALDSEGNLIAAGFRTDDDRDLYMLKLTPSGDRVWDRQYGAELGTDAIPRSLVVDADGTMLVAGERTGADGSMDAWLAALAP